jgi:hypothetical protein
MPLDRQGINAGAWSGRPPHRPGPQLPVFCRTRRPTTVAVTASSLIALRLLVLLGLAFQLSTLLLVLAGPVPPRAVSSPTPSSAPMPAVMPVRFHPSHRFQTDEKHRHVIPSR